MTIDDLWCETRYVHYSIQNNKYFYGHISDNIFFWDQTTSLVECPICNGTHYVNIEK